MSNYFNTNYITYSSSNIKNKELISKKKLTHCIIKLLLDKNARKMPGNSNAKKKYCKFIQKMHYWFMHVIQNCNITVAKLILSA